TGVAYGSTEAAALSLWYSKRAVPDRAKAGGIATPAILGLLPALGMEEIGAAVAPAFIGIATSAATTFACAEAILVPPSAALATTFLRFASLAALALRCTKIKALPATEPPPAATSTTCASGQQAEAITPGTIASPRFASSKLAGRGG